MKIFLMRSFFLLFFVVLCMGGCAARKDYPGLEYAPQMYHSTPYEGLSQITDTTQGTWLTSREGEGEFYNSNPYNPHGMTMRRPVEGTVRRRGYRGMARWDDSTQYTLFLPYDVPKDSLALAARVLRNPLDSSEAVLKSGGVLYQQFCSHCHGKEGRGDGLVGEVYGGVTSYSSRAVQNVSEGHIFHVITYGKGRMASHGSQISPEDRWKIVRYVQYLQKK